MADSQLYGGIEAGGTKFVCIVGDGPGNIVDEARFRTTVPGETMPQVVDFFRPHVSAGEIKAIGVGCFGPVDLDRRSATYGYITSTPKLPWRNTDFVGTLKRELGVAVGFDTDVNAAGLGEYRWGSNKGMDPLLYLTVGTGIGGGCVQDGKPRKGMLSPEMGHVRLPHDFKKDPFPGACPYHGDCLEGLASGPAIEKRLGKSGKDLADDDPFWELEARYLALALVGYVLVISPRRIVLGGGVMEHECLFPMIRKNVKELLNDYVQHENLMSAIDEYIVPPGLGNRSGSLGALALAELAAGA